MLSFFTRHLKLAFVQKAMHHNVILYHIRLTFCVWVLVDGYCTTDVKIRTGIQFLDHPLYHWCIVHYKSINLYLLRATDNDKNDEQQTRALALAGEWGYKEQ